MAPVYRTGAGVTAVTPVSVSFQERRAIALVEAFGDRAPLWAKQIVSKLDNG